MIALCFGNDPPDTPVRLVTQGIDIGVALAVLGIEAPAIFVRGRVVLHDKVVPVGHPNVAVGTDLSLYRGDPFVGPGEEVAPVLFYISGTVFFDLSDVYQTTGRFADKGVSIPIFLGIVPGRIKMMSRGSGKSPENIHLAIVRGDGPHIVMAVDLDASLGGN